MGAAALGDPDVLRAHSSIASFIATPDEVLAEPGLLDKVLSIGAGAPRYAGSGPSRVELLTAIG